jgi:signal transduction histidine kinase
MDEARILVIDDEVGMREGCRRALTPHGYQIETAEHGAAGLQKLRSASFDLILVDAMMPGMGGLELLQRIREQGSDIVCIMITGYATVDLAAKAMKQGAFDFLPKPFTSDELLTAVEKGLTEHSRRRAQKLEMEKREDALELDRTRQEIAKLDAIQSRFMLVIAHELRNPAGVIKNYLQIMRAGYVDEDEWDEYLEKLDLRASQLLQMLDDILELAYLKESLTSSKAESIDAANVLEQVAHRLKDKALAKGLSFEVEIQARPTIQAVRAHLDSLWTNLLNNAVQYTPSGYVRATLTVEGDQMVSTVADTGIGLSTEELGRMFQEFYRSETAQAEVPLGTGLGLTIVDQIAKIYHGTVQVESSPGQGATFAVRLPLAYDQQS